MTDKPTEYSVLKMASLLMLSDRRIQQLAKEGVLPKSARGKYELAPTVQAYISYLRDRAAEPSDGDEDYGKNRARLTRLRADMADLELKLMQEKYLPIADIESSVVRDYSSLRAKLQQIGTKVADRGISMSNPGELQDLVDTYIRESLEELRFDKELERKSAEIAKAETEKEKQNTYLPSDDIEDEGDE